MSNRELAKNLIDQIPEGRLIYIIPYLRDEASEKEANEETLAAIAEVDEMIKTGAGEHFTGTTAEFFAALAEE